MDLWRAMTELPGYICIVRQKRETVARLVRMMRTFARSGGIKQESCLLEAPPGAGKTHLVRCLANLENFRLLPFNITHLYHQEGLLDCFDRISTTQAEIRDQPLLIFFDEINASLDGEQVYSSFLSLLEEGIYVRAEKSFHIRPAVWLFAGTGLDPAAIKAPDFRSRLTQGIASLALPEHDPEGDFAQLERVYLGAQLLKNVFPEIEYVSEDVLDLFRRLPRNVSIRQISELAKHFRDVKRRRVGHQNIPWSWVQNNSGFETAVTRSLQVNWEGYWAPRREREGVRDVKVVAKRA